MKLYVLLYIIVILSSFPSAATTRAPTPSPTTTPTIEPTAAPSKIPTLSPTAVPTKAPTAVPSSSPTLVPTAAPTRVPTVEPTAAPTVVPTAAPTQSPTRAPTAAPTAIPTAIPTAPTVGPTATPTQSPTVVPTRAPTVGPTLAPTAPTASPTRAPTAVPTQSPTRAPTVVPTAIPTAPTAAPTVVPTVLPTAAPTASPTAAPTLAPTCLPSGQPSRQPTSQPLSRPTGQPSRQPSRRPTGQPTSAPSGRPWHVAYVDNNDGTYSITFEFTYIGYVEVFPIPRWIPTFSTGLSSVAFNVFGAQGGCGGGTGGTISAFIGSSNGGYIVTPRSYLYIGVGAAGSGRLANSASPPVFGGGGGSGGAGACGGGGASFIKGDLTNLYLVAGGGGGMGAGAVPLTGSGSAAAGTVSSTAAATPSAITAATLPTTTSGGIAGYCTDSNGAVYQGSSGSSGVGGIGGSTLPTTSRCNCTYLGSEAHGGGGGGGYFGGGGGYCGSGSGGSNYYSPLSGMQQLPVTSPSTSVNGKVQIVFTIISSIAPASTTWGLSSIQSMNPEHYDDSLYLQYTFTYTGFPEIFSLADDRVLPLSEMLIQVSGAQGGYNGGLGGVSIARININPSYYVNVTVGGHGYPYASPGGSVGGGGAVNEGQFGGGGGGATVMTVYNDKGVIVGTIMAGGGGGSVSGWSVGGPGGGTMTTSQGLLAVGEKSYQSYLTPSRGPNGTVAGGAAGFCTSSSNTIYNGGATAGTRLQGGMGGVTVANVDDCSCGISIAKSGGAGGGGYFGGGGGYCGGGAGGSSYSNGFQTVLNRVGGGPEGNGLASLIIAINPKPTSQPTGQPTNQPSARPSRLPTGQPTRQPSRQPTSDPSRQPSGQPTRQPTSQPSSHPTLQPFSRPTGQPTKLPTSQPTGQPSLQPSSQPTRQPTSRPTGQPSRMPTTQPTRQPTSRPTSQPSRYPTSQPTRHPTGQPTRQPTRQPTSDPSRRPTSQPSVQPSRHPSGQPTRLPTSQPSSRPSRHPTSQPTRQPSLQPSAQPTSQPTKQPSSQPSRQPTNDPTRQPTSRPSSQPTSRPTRGGYRNPDDGGKVTWIFSVTQDIADDIQANTSLANVLCVPSHWESNSFRNLCGFRTTFLFCLQDYLWRDIDLGRCEINLDPGIKKVTLSAGPLIFPKPTVYGYKIFISCKGGTIFETSSGEPFILYDSSLSQPTTPTSNNSSSSATPNGRRQLAAAPSPLPTFATSSQEGKGSIIIENAVFKGFKGSKMSGGSLHNAGGVISINGFAEVILMNVTFADNEADLYGGSIYIRNTASVILNGVKVSSSIATNGGAAFFSNVGSLSIIRSTFESSTATNIGGCVSIDMSKDVTIYNSVFKSCKSSTFGAAVSVFNVLGSANITNSIFTASVAGTAGIIILRAIARILVTQSTFTSNTLNTGGVIYWISSNYPESVYGNNGLVSTGIPILSRNVFQDNNVGGILNINNVASEPLLVRSYPNNLLLTDYNPGAMPLTVDLQVIDYYNQVATFVNNSNARLYIDVPSRDTSCSYNLAQVEMTGHITDVVHRGEVLMDNFDISCIPGGSVNFTSSVEVPTVSVEFPVYNVTAWQGVLYSPPLRPVKNRIGVSFRQCIRGEYFDFFNTKSKCLECGSNDFPNAFSFALNDDNSVTTCRPCPPKAVKCYGDKIILKPGTWRWNNFASSIFDCPYPVGCLGGNLTGQASCDAGYLGPLCALCEWGYYTSPNGDSCMPCKGTGSVATTQILFMLAGVVGVLFLVTYFVLLNKKRMAFLFKIADEFTLGVLSASLSNKMKRRIGELANDEGDKKEKKGSDSDSDSDSEGEEDETEFQDMDNWPDWKVIAHAKKVITANQIRKRKEAKKAATAKNSKSLMSQLSSKNFFNRSDDAETNVYVDIRTRSEAESVITQELQRRKTFNEQLASKKIASRFKMRSILGTSKKGVGGNATSSFASKSISSPQYRRISLVKPEPKAESEKLSTSNDNHDDDDNDDSDDDDDLDDDDDNHGDKTDTPTYLRRTSRVSPLVPMDQRRISRQIMVPSSSNMNEAMSQLQQLRDQHLAEESAQRLAKREARDKRRKAKEDERAFRIEIGEDPDAEDSDSDDSDDFFDEEEEARFEEQRRKRMEMLSDPSAGRRQGEIFEKVKKEKVRRVKKSSTWTARMKIAIATYQIVISSPMTLQVNFGPWVNQLINAFKFINFDFVKILPVQCYTTFNYVSSMITFTLVPILFWTFLFIVYMIQSYYLRKKGGWDEDYNRKLLRIRYISIFVMIAYMMLPGEAVKIIRTFSCQDFDPNHEDNTGASHSFLIADLGVDCNSPFYLLGRKWAIIMAGFYPVGLPIMFFALLYRFRDKIMTRDVVEYEDEDDDDEEAAKKSSMAHGLKFLYSSYKPELPFWELVETSRRLILTAVSAVIAPGTLFQLAVTISIAVVYLSLYVAYNPYLENADNKLAILGQWQIFILFYGAYIIKTDTITDPNLLNLLDFFIAFANIGIIAMVFIFSVQDNAYEAFITALPDEKYHFWKFRSFKKFMALIVERKAIDDEEAERRLAEDARREAEEKLKAEEFEKKLAESKKIVLVSKTNTPNPSKQNTPTHSRANSITSIAESRASFSSAVSIYSDFAERLPVTAELHPVLGVASVKSSQGGDGMDELRAAISQLKERLAQEERERSKLEEKIKQEMLDKEKAIAQELQGLMPKAPIISSKEAMQLRAENDDLKKKIESVSSGFAEAFNQKKEELLQLLVEKESIIADLRRQINDLRDQIAELTLKVTKKDSTITRLISLLEEIKIKAREKEEERERERQREKEREAIKRQMEKDKERERQDRERERERQQKEKEMEERERERQLREKEREEERLERETLKEEFERERRELEWERQREREEMELQMQREKERMELERAKERQQMEREREKERQIDMERLQQSQKEKEEWEREKEQILEMEEKREQERQREWEKELQRLKELELQREKEMQIEIEREVQIEIEKRMEILMKEELERKRHPWREGPAPPRKESPPPLVRKDSSPQPMLRREGTKSDLTRGGASGGGGTGLREKEMSKDKTKDKDKDQDKDKDKDKERERWGEKRDKGRQRESPRPLASSASTSASASAPLSSPVPKPPSLSLFKGSQEEKSVRQSLRTALMLARDSLRTGKSDSQLSVTSTDTPPKTTTSDAVGGESSDASSALLPSLSPINLTSTSRPSTGNASTEGSVSILPDRMSQVGSILPPIDTQAERDIDNNSVGQRSIDKTAGAAQIHPKQTPKSILKSRIDGSFFEISSSSEDDDDSTESSVSTDDDTYFASLKVPSSSYTMKKLTKRVGGARVVKKVNKAKKKTQKKN